MAATVNVLLPTGRRQNVKVTPNTRILVVIENVCSKIGYNPDEYNLKHHHGILDPQLSVRYANLPNNCKLELVKADRPRTESTVVIALQTESGQRLQNEFVPSVSLWDVLLHTESKDSAYAGKLASSSQSDDAGKIIHPVCVYMRQEVVGEAWLRATTLRSLGLTGGKAAIRVIHRAMELQAPPVTPSTKPTSPPAKVETPTEPLAQVSHEQSIPEKRGGDGSKPAEGQRPQNVSASSETSIKNSDTSLSVGGQSNKQVEQSATSDEPMEVEESTSARQSFPEKPGKSLDDGTGARQKQNETPTQMEVAKLQDTREIVLSPELEQRANQMGSAIADAILQHRTEQQLSQLKQAWSTQPQRQPVFTDFKFPELPAGPSHQSESRQLRAGKEQEPCERQPLVFNQDQSSDELSSATQDVPDEFFNVTLDDVRKMMADQQLQTRANEGEQLLETRAMREAKSLKKAQQYTKVAVRIHFPDRHVLQGFFRPLETISSLREFVRSNLQDPKVGFYLYTTPPRCVLKDDKQSLFEAKLFPAAVVHFGSETSCKHYLLSELIKEPASFSKAEEEASTVIRTNLTQSSSGSINRKSAATVSGASTSQSSTLNVPPKDPPQGSGKRQASGETAQKSEQKIPKWFKIGKR
ncbi:tether containing UBX domain for GLUT4-like [Asterias amurensis]|uniref:tether containing UBX domain for GLUT4-like n=1 Tax=Asterias amurensis TaxID=7602 RepID=UPI003AB6A712